MRILSTFDWKTSLKSLDIDVLTGPELNFAHAEPRRQMKAMPAKWNKSASDPMGAVCISVFAADIFRNEEWMFFEL